MRKTIVLSAVGGAVLSPFIVNASQAATPGLNGPHGCVLSDVGGNSPPVFHDSVTSHIGGNKCTYTQVASDPSIPQGGSYSAAAQFWSVKSYARLYNKAAKRWSWVADPHHSYSSAAHSPSVGQYVIPVGDKVTVRVSNGFIITGTPNGAPGS